jgi:TRAP-type uncharacterized transport system substrate-binding protein
MSVREFVRRHPVLPAAAAASFAAACLLWVFFVVGRPLPPRHVVMTTGPDGGAFREFGEKYRVALAKEGIDLKLVPSLGSVENLKRLKDSASGVSAGFLSGGLTSAKDSPEILSLGTISYNPLWIFCRGLPEPVRMKSLQGKRVSIGPEGSGTRAMVLELLRANDMLDAFTALPLGPGGGGEALLRGEIDCACMQTGADAPIVKKLLADERVSLAAFPRADAYVALYPHLRKLTVPRGVGDLAKDLPKGDVTLLASMTTLAVREDLHPAIQFLLLEAASDIHSEPGILRRPGQFPAAEPIDVPLSKDAHAYYKSGGSFLQRHLPFWLGVLAERILLVLVPLAGVLYPLLRVAPAMRTWVIEQRLWRLYTELREIEEVIANGSGDGAEALRILERKVNLVRVPKRFARVLYTLKQHVALVGERLGKARPDERAS